MSRFDRRARFLVCLGIFFAALVPLPVSSNPVSPPLGIGLENVRQIIVFGLICVYIVLIEGTFIKLMLFRLDGITWPKAMLVALVLNVLSAIVGLKRGMYFDTYRFEFNPGPMSVFGVSLLVEGIFLVLIFARRKPLRALLTVGAMNLATYTIMLMSRFPEGIKLFFEY